jgi:hypothetical protein
VKRLVLVAAVGLLAAGCGGSKPATTATTATVSTPDPAAAMRTLIAADLSLAGTVRTLYEGTSWAVVQSTAPGKASAVAFHLAGGKWLPDRSDEVKITILGPERGARAAPATPQVAIEFKAPQPFVESALWVDGTELQEKGGGSPTSGTIYGAPAKPLTAGPHVAVGYARTATTGTAVAWVFDVG